MKAKNSVKLLCELLDVNRSGYYKWLKHKDVSNRYEKDRELLTELLHEEHQKHPSYGYHSLAHEEYNIVRSMSRGGTPTDNPVIEALNGWIKEELYQDFDLANTADVPDLLDKYVTYYNEERSAYSLN